MESSVSVTIEQLPSRRLPPRPQHPTGAVQEALSVFSLSWGEDLAHEATPINDIELIDLHRIYTGQ